MRKVQYGRAINYALEDAMTKDPAVYLLGQDIGYGGVYSVTQGLRKKFGDARVLDTPLAENLIIGHAMGASLLGRKPVAEIQFSDFVSVAFPILTQFAASYRWRSGGKVGIPLVVRLPFGGGASGGPFHSQCPEPWFLNVPGFKLVFPSTPADAYGLLRTAIDDPDPVLYFEHKRLYWRKEYIEDIPEPGEAQEFIPFGKARLMREGNDCLLVSYGWTARMASDAADSLQKEGISCAVLDLRTLVPLDREQLTRLARTIGKVLIIHEAPKEWGPGGWLAQVIREADQHVAIETLGSQFTPPPFSPSLEKFYLPSVEKIISAVHALVGSRHEPQQSPQGTNDPAQRRIALTPLRKAVAEKVSQSKATIPHAVTEVKVDATDLLEARAARRDAWREEHGFAPTPFSCVAYAAVSALAEYPYMNSSFRGDHIAEFKDCNLAVTMEVAGKGLMAPVIRNANLLSFWEFTKALHELTEQAKAGDVSQMIFSDATFTVNNPGAYGSEGGYSIILPPHAAILSMRKIQKQAVVREQGGVDAVVVRSIMPLGVSFDHRAMDGKAANAYISALKKIIEDVTQKPFWN